MLIDTRFSFVNRSLRWVIPKMSRSLNLDRILLAAFSSPPDCLAFQLQDQLFSTLCAWERSEMERNVSLMTIQSSLRHLHGNLSKNLAWNSNFKDDSSLTWVVPHPHLKAISCASNSPNPSIIPLTKGSNKLIAAPLIKVQKVGRL